MQFVPARRRPYVIDWDDRIDRRGYERRTLWELLGALSRHAGSFPGARPAGML